MPDGIVEQLVDYQSNWLDEKRGDHDVIPIEADAGTVRPPKLSLNYLA
jgi:fructose-1,6-bisphosphatase